MFTAAGDRFDRSRGRSIESIDSVDSIFFDRSQNFWKIDHGETIDSVKKSLKYEPSSRFFGRLKILVIFDSIDSIFFSIRSILSRTTAGDRLEEGEGRLACCSSVARASFKGSSVKISWMNLSHANKLGYLSPRVPGFCQNVPGAAGAAAAAAAGAAAATALIFPTTWAAPCAFWQNPCTPGKRYPFVPM